MNVQLYNALVSAKEFVLRDAQYCKDIEACESAVGWYNMQKNMNTAPFKEEPISWVTVIFWLWVFFPIGLFIIFANKHKNKVNRKKHEQKNQEILNSSEEIEYRKNIQKKIEEAKVALEQAKKVRNDYYRQNREKCLGFLSDYSTSSETIDALIHYVKTEQAYTLNQAQNCYAKDLLEMDEMRRRSEEREERDRQHRETQEALNTIAKNQEKINHELEVANKYRNGMYR